MYRKCTKCGTEAHSMEEAKSLKFIKDKGSKYGFKNKCYLRTITDNSTQQMRDWKTKHQVWKRYACTPEEYKERMASSNCCEVCSRTEELCYDHDHLTMKFRGVLCRGCNRSLGQLGDDEAGILKVLAYLHN